jgi:hypothetical protein
VVAYFSKTLLKADRNYCMTRRELLAILKTLEHFHKYLYRQEFHLLTDHSALTWLLSFENLEGQTAHWVQCLQGYNFTSENRQGRRHTKVDAVSRRPCQEEYFHCLKVEQRSNGLKIRVVRAATANDWDLAALRREQLVDDDLGAATAESTVWIMRGVERHQRQEPLLQMLLCPVEIASSKGRRAGALLGVS